MISVVPSLPASSFDEISKLAHALQGTVPELQIDIVDGKFVPAISWPFTESAPKEALQKLAPLADSFDIEVDCMMRSPEEFLETFVSLGVKRVVVHLRSTDAYDDCIDHAHAHGYKIGFAFTNDVPLTEVEPYIDSIDFVQVMGIAHVGKQEQTFDERTLHTVETLRMKYPNLEIAVDGSVNKDTIVSLKDAGVNRFAPGSAIAKQEDPKAAYLHLLSLVS